MDSTDSAGSRYIPKRQRTPNRITRSIEIADGLAETSGFGQALVVLPSAAISDIIEQSAV
jgi:hypothetical protein